jgi:hypothetical protein
VKTGFAQIVGRRISGVIFKQALYPKQPESQLFLLFDDGTYYEFYASRDLISQTGGVDKGGIEEVRRYMAGPQRWPVLAALNDAGDARALLRDIAIGSLAVKLQYPGVSVPDLKWTIDALAKIGWDWRALYQEALKSRPRGLPPAPGVEALAC